MSRNQSSQLRNHAWTKQTGLVALHLSLLTTSESNNLLSLEPGGENPMTLKLINPASLGEPKGFSNGVLTESSGKLLFIAGQIGWDARQIIVSEDFIEQFNQALANVLAVVIEAGGSADQIARLVIYVTDKEEYRLNLKAVGESYRRHMGRHFPAMVLVEVKSLLEDRAKVEIEGVAVLSS